MAKCYRTVADCDIALLHNVRLALLSYGCTASVWWPLALRHKGMYDGAARCGRLLNAMTV